MAQTSQGAYDRRSFLYRLWQGAAVAAVAMLGLGGKAVEGKAQESEVLCISQEKYKRLVAEGKLPPESKCKCCPPGCC